jgi:hypothetical protein
MAVPFHCFKISHLKRQKEEINNRNKEEIKRKEIRNDTKKANEC